jgi:hypothetical protein
MNLYKDRRKDKRYGNYMLRKLKVGSYVEDCRYHPSIVTAQDRHHCDFQCQSLVNGKPWGCSMYNCGPVPLSKQEAYERAAVMKEQGMEAYLRRYHGHTEADIEDWRKLDAEWNFDKGT